MAKHPFQPHLPRLWPGWVEPWTDNVLDSQPADADSLPFSVHRKTLMKLLGSAEVAQKMTRFSNSQKTRDQESTIKGLLEDACAVHSIHDVDSKRMSAAHVRDDIRDLIRRLTDVSSKLKRLESHLGPAKTVKYLFVRHLSGDPSAFTAKHFSRFEAPSFSPLSSVRLRELIAELAADLAYRLADTRWASTHPERKKHRGPIERQIDTLIEMSRKRFGTASPTLIATIVSVMNDADVSVDRVRKRERLM